MTSAVLAGRNEVHHHWGDARAPLMPKPANPNSNPNPRHHHRRPSASPIPNPIPNPAPSRAAAAAEASPSGYVTFRPSGLAHGEARELRARLVGELGQVRALLSRIDTWQQQRRRHESPPPGLLAAMLKRCGQILMRLRKQKQSVWFNDPVDVEGLGLHDYHTIIKNPMDLGTVRDNLSAGRYPSHDAFASDVRLTFANALRYNPVGHQVNTFARNLLTSFEEMYKDAVSWFEQECQRLQPLMPAPVPTPLTLPPQSQPQMQMPVPVPMQPQPRRGSAKRRKPKAREPNKREMSADEKQKLREALETLPGEKMMNVLQIVRKRNSGPDLLGDEVELDFDEMDVETLWELDRFVVNYKKALNKIQRTALMNNDTVGVAAVVAEDDAVLVNVNPLMVVDAGDSESDAPAKGTKEAEPVDEYVDIGDDMPTANYQSVEIEKDAEMASSSSGSGSGSSSSSGSDSGSSGDSDSDGDDARSPN